MTTVIEIKKEDFQFADEVAKVGNLDVRKCYQCGKCTAGCPVAKWMDPPVHKIMQLVQMGRRDDVLTSKGIWMCVSCETCTARCPKDAKPSYVVDAVREISLRENLVTREAANVLAFHEAFLESVRKYGRVFEVGMIRDYKMRTLRLMEDVPLGIRMFLLGKLGLKPHKVKDIKTVEKIFEKFFD